MGIIPEMKAKTDCTLTEDPYHAYTGTCDSRRSIPCCRKVLLMTCTIYIDRQISFPVLYYLHRQLLRQEMVKDFHQAGRKFTFIPCTIHIDRKKVLLVLYYSHRQQLGELASKKTYIKYA